MRRTPPLRPSAALANRSNTAPVRRQGLYGDLLPRSPLKVLYPSRNCLRRTAELRGKHSKRDPPSPGGDNYLDVNRIGHEWSSISSTYRMLGPPNETAQVAVAVVFGKAGFGKIINFFAFVSTTKKHHQAHWDGNGEKDRPSGRFRHSPISCIRLSTRCRRFSPSASRRAISSLSSRS